MGTMQSHYRRSEPTTATSSNRKHSSVYFREEESSNDSISDDVYTLDNHARDYYGYVDDNVQSEEENEEREVIEMKKSVAINEHFKGEAVVRKSRFSFGAYEEDSQNSIYQLQKHKESPLLVKPKRIYVKTPQMPDKMKKKNKKKNIVFDTKRRNIVKKSIWSTTSEKKETNKNISKGNSIISTKTMNIAHLYRSVLSVASNSTFHGKKKDLDNNEVKKKTSEKNSKPAVMFNLIKSHTQGNTAIDRKIVIKSKPKDKIGGRNFDMNKIEQETKKISFAVRNNNHINRTMLKSIDTAVPLYHDGIYPDDNTEDVGPDYNSSSQSSSNTSSPCLEGATTDVMNNNVTTAFKFNKNATQRQSAGISTDIVENLDSTHTTREGKEGHFPKSSPYRKRYQNRRNSKNNDLLPLSPVLSPPAPKNSTLRRRSIPRTDSSASSSSENDDNHSIYTSELLPVSNANGTMVRTSSGDGFIPQTQSSSYDEEELQASSSSPSRIIYVQASGTMTTLASSGTDRTSMLESSSDLYPLSGSSSFENGDLLRHGMTLDEEEEMDMISGLNNSKGPYGPFVTNDYSDEEDEEEQSTGENSSLCSEENSSLYSGGVLGERIVTTPASEECSYGKNDEVTPRLDEMCYSPGESTNEENTVFSTGKKHSLDSGSQVETDNKVPSIKIDTSIPLISDGNYPDATPSPKDSDMNLFDHGDESQSHVPSTVPILSERKKMMRKHLPLSPFRSPSAPTNKTRVQSIFDNSFGASGKGNNDHPRVEETSSRHIDTAIPLVGDGVYPYSTPTPDDAPIGGMNFDDIDIKKNTEHSKGISERKLMMREALPLSPFRSPPTPRNKSSVAMFEQSQLEEKQHKYAAPARIDTTGPMVGDGAYPYSTPTPEDAPAGGMTFEDDDIKTSRNISERKQSMRCLLPISSVRSPATPRHGRVNKHDSVRKFNENDSKILAAPQSIDTTGIMVGDGAYPHATPTPEDAPVGGMSFEENDIKVLRTMSERKQSIRSLLPISSVRSPATPRNGRNKKLDSVRKFNENDSEAFTAPQPIDTSGPMVGDGAYPYATPTPEDAPVGGMSFEDHDMKILRTMSERKQSIRSVLPISSVRSPATPRNGRISKQHSRRTFDDSKVPTLAVRTNGPLIGDGAYPDATPSPQNPSQDAVFFEGGNPEHKINVSMSERKNCMRSALPLSPFRSPPTPKNSYKRGSLTFLDSNDVDGGETIKSTESLCESNSTNVLEQIEPSPRAIISFTPPPGVKDAIRRFSQLKKISPKRKTPPRKFRSAVFNYNKNTLVMKRVTEYNGQLKRNRMVKRKGNRRETSGHEVIAPYRPKLVSSLFRHNSSDNNDSESSCDKSESSCDKSDEYPAGLESLTPNKPILMEESKCFVRPWEIRGVREQERNNADEIIESENPEDRPTLLKNILIPPQSVDGFNSNSKGENTMSMSSQVAGPKQQARKWRQYAAANALVLNKDPYDDNTV